MQFSLSLVNAGIIIRRIRLNGIDLKQIAADCFLNEFGYDLRVALFNIFYTAVPVVFALAGVVDDYILCYVPIMYRRICLISI